MRTSQFLFIALSLLFSSSALLADDLTSCLTEQEFRQHWTIESESSDYQLHFLHDTLEVVAPKGLTLWRNERMEGRTVVEYDACLMDEGREGDRVSDLNCFWMASDPKGKLKSGEQRTTDGGPQTGSVFTRMKQRSGVFRRCYTMQLYYLGYGGNSNTTTRFRRYRAEAGTMTEGEALQPEQLPQVIREYTDAAHLNVANRWRHIRVEADGMKIRYYIDGECLVDYRDREPLTSGWFGVRTTWSRLRIAHFRCHTEPLSEEPTSGISLHWIEQPQTDSVTVRFGVPFERGQVKATDQFRLNGQELDFYPLAYWPDRSLKWGGFAGFIANDTAYTLQLQPRGKKQTNARTVNGGLSNGKLSNCPIHIEETSTQYVITNGDSRLYLPRQAGASSLMDSLLFCGTPTCQQLRVETDGRAATLDSLLIERQSTRQVVVKCCASGDSIDYIVRLYVNAGSPVIRVVHSLVYLRTPAQPAPHSIALRADVPLQAQAYNRHVAFTTDEGKLWHEPVQPVTGRRSLSLDGNGRGPEELYHQQMQGLQLPEPEAFNENNRGYLSHWATWDRYRLSQPLDEGFSIRKSAKPDPQTPWIGTLTGHRATGGVFIGEAPMVNGKSSNGKCVGLALGMEDFWQSYPSTLLIEGATSPLATVTLYLWSPEAEPMDLRHYDTVAHDLDASYEDVQESMSTPQGIGRTSVIMLQPTQGYPGDEALTRLFSALTQQPQLICTPQYLHAQHAFGVWSLPDTLYNNIEHDLTYWSDFMVGEVKRRHWYGFWNYGDVMHAYDPERQEWRYDIGGFAWDNTELASNMMLWYNFLRTARPDLWHMAVAMTRHTSEVDVYHEGPFKGLGSRHNVSHWGCGSKEARISQALWNRFYYYLSGGDERLGQLMSAQRDLDTLLYHLDPMRLAQPRGLYPCTAPARLRIGPDWLAYAANWMTEYERTLNPYYWQKMLTGMNCISAFPSGIFTGPKALGYDPATGIISWEGDPTLTHTNHLLFLMGGFEFVNELMDIREVPDSWRQTWLQFCSEYLERAGGKSYAVSRLPAYAGNVHDAMEQLDRGHQSPDRFSTNGISTWSLDAIYMLEVCPPVLH